MIDRADSFGSVVCRYGANTASNIFVAAMVQRNGSPISFHFDNQMLDNGRNAGTIQSVWWWPRSTVSDYLVLANISARPMVAEMTVSDLSGHRSQQSIALQPAQTQRLDLGMLTRAAGLSGSQGGLTVSAASGAGGLIASHIVFDPTTGMSAIMKTFDGDLSEKPRVHTMRAPMMALSVPDPVLMFPAGTKLIPQLFLRNTTESSLNATLELDWRAPAKSGRLALPPMTLAPGEVRLFDLADATTQAQLPAEASWGTVVLQYEGRSGDLVPIATSFDDSGRYGLQTPFTEGTAHLLKGSMWHVDLTHNSLITTGNGGTRPIHAALTLFYNGGKGSYTMEKLLAPGEQIWADVGQMIRDHVPDKDGKTIPADVMMGSYELRDVDHPSAGNLYEGKLVLDRTWGHGYYGCTICCGYHASKLNPNPFSGLIGTGGSDQAQAEDCSNTWWDFTDIATNWASSNTGVATVASAYTHLVGVGNATGSANLQLANTNIHTNCPVVLFIPQNPVQVPPTITQSKQLWFFGIGNTPPTTFTLGDIKTTLTASGASGGSFAWTITAGTSKASFASGVSQSSTTTSSNAVTLYSLSYSTSSNDVTVSLTWTDANGVVYPAQSLSLSVDSPYKLVPYSPTVTNSGATNCTVPATPGPSGWQTLVYYQMISFFGVILKNQWINESFGNLADDTVNNWPVYSAGYLLSSTGTFTDNICVLQIAGRSPVATAPQSPLSGVKVDHGTQGWFIGSELSAGGVQVQTDTLQRYVDHGGHFAIVSPVR